MWLLVSRETRRVRASVTPRRICRAGRSRAARGEAGVACADLTREIGEDAVERHGAEVVARAVAQTHGAVFGLAGADDEHVRHLPHLRVANAVAELLVAVVELGTDAGAAQARVLPISEKHIDYARTVHGRLRAARIRAELDDRNEKLGYRIRDAQVRKVPYMLVVGAREAENGTVSLRHRSGDDLGAVPIDRVLADLTREIGSRDASLAVGRA